jgi:uncharacterized protein involved in outer membrane biogenesis
MDKRNRGGDLQPEAAKDWPDTRRTWFQRHRGLALGGGAFVVAILAIVIFLALFDWDWVRGPIARYASARTGREVRIEGHLKVHLLTWTPTARVGGLRIGNPKWAGAGDTAQVRQLTVSAKLMPLLIGQLDMPLVDLDHPRFDLLRTKDDQENWVLNPKNAGKPMRLPPIQRFIVRDGALTLNDAHRNLILTGTINAAEESAGLRTGRQGFELIGKGTLNKDPFLLEATGGPLVHVQRNKPYPFHMDLKAGATHVLADAQLTKPFNLGEMNGQLQVSGPNLFDLYPLTGVVFPATPHYDLATHFDRKNARFELTAIRGRVGDSDLEGVLTVDKPKDRRTVTADLTSRRLVFADLLAVIGGGPKAAAAKGGPSAPPPTPSGRMMPDAPLQMSRLRTMDADVKYRAASVVTAKWPLRRVALDLKLDDGLLVINPLEFEFPQGKLAGRVSINGRKTVPVTDLDMRLTNVALQQFLPSKGGTPALEGTLQARAQLHGVGDTIHKAASSADGKVVLVVPHGKVRQSLAELLGINVANGLYLLLSNDTRETDLRCAVADFNVKNGVMNVSNAVFDTGVVRAQGKGSVNLGAETLDLRLEGQTKKPRILRLWAPITLKGTLLHPQPGVDVGKAAGQIGIAVAVGAVLAPLAAILPFIEPGLAKDADCAALVGEAKASGAPVKVSAATPAAPAKH